MFSISDFLTATLRIAGVVPNTLLLVCGILLSGIILGFCLDVLERTGNKVIRAVVNVYVSYMRGVPVIVNLFIASSVLPPVIVKVLSAIGVAVPESNIPPIVPAFISLALFETALQTESIRGILRSVDRDQYDAAYSIGMTRFQTWRRIILPQLALVAAPILINSFVTTMKTVSLIFSVAVVEIFATAQLTASLTGRYLESYLAAALIYWVICGVLTLFSTYLERRHAFGKGQQRHRV